MSYENHNNRTYCLDQYFAQPLHIMIVERLSKQLKRNTELNYKECHLFFSLINMVKSKNRK